MKIMKEKTAVLIIGRDSYEIPASIGGASVITASNLIIEKWLSWN